MILTDDQYLAIGQMEKWYRQYRHQFIDIAGVLGTGTWQLIQAFIELIGLDKKEVMYLSYDQKQVLELAARKFHAYYINGIIYNYTRILDFDSLPVINSSSTEIQYQWKKSVRKKIDDRYKLIIVLDSSLANDLVINDLKHFGLPVILVRDPMMIPSADSYTYNHEPNIFLKDLHPTLIRNPIVYFANKVLQGEDLNPGTYDNVSIVPRKQMNLYNLKTADMVLTMSDSVRNEINNIYRSKILKLKTNVNVTGERLIVANDMYAHRLVNKDEKNIKIYLRKGMVGHITQINKHVPSTKYVPIEFRPEFYHVPFEDLILDRHYLNNIELPTKQLIPDEIIKMEYAYALTPVSGRYSHWDKVTLICDNDDCLDSEMAARMIYSAIALSRKSLAIMI